MSPERLGDERLRFTLISGSSSRDVGGAITSVSWDDTSMEVTGQLTGQAPLAQLQFRDGDRIRCEFAPGADATFRRLWTLALEADDGNGISRELETDETTGVLVSTLSRYRGMTMDFSFRKDASHPRGWTVDQIVRDVGRRTGMPLGKIARGTHRITNLVKRNADPMDVILIAYRQEREATGRRFFASWDGALNLTVLTYSKDLLELLPVLISGQYTEQRRSDFATILDVRIAARKGKRTTKKIRTRVTDAAGVKRYGSIIKSVSPKNIDTVSGARAWARQSLARRQTPKRELTVTVPLIPAIRRGDALRVAVPGVPGLMQVVYVRSASHTWSGGTGTTSLVVRFDDPYTDARVVKVSKSKADKARKRGKKAPKHTRPSDPPKPKNRARRT